MSKKISEFPVVSSPHLSATIPIIQQGNNYRISLSSLATEGSVISVAGRTGSVVLSADDIVGLSNVDNTSDSDKPVSTAQQTALNLKLNSATLQSLSSNWQNTFTTVNANSGSWGSGGGGGSDVSGLSANWQSTFNTVKNLSSGWGGGSGSDVSAISGNWQSTFNTVKGLSSRWEGVYTTVGANSAAWLASGSDVTSLSSNWQTSSNTVRSLSSNWQSTFTTVAGNSAVWTASDVRGLSANWQSTYNTVKGLSSGWTASDVRGLSGNWQNTYTTVNANSGAWTGSVALLSATIASLSSYVRSDITGISGATKVNNMFTLAQSSYDAITPDPYTFYIII